MAACSDGSIRRDVRKLINNHNNHNDHNDQRQKRRNETMGAENNTIRVDPDGVINLVAYRARGVWAAQLRIPGSPTIRTAGRLNSSASAHTLLSVALTATLRSISKPKAAELSGGRFKPVIELRCSDPTFFAALQAKAQRLDQPRFRVGRNFHVELARQLARISPVFVTEEKSFLALKNWALQTVPDPRMDIAFEPAVVSQPIYVQQ
jgi:hypothetical protein